MTRRRNLGVWMLAGLAGICITAVIAALLIVGGPGQARDEAFDKDVQRSLLSANWGLICFYEQNASLPESLSDLETWTGLGSRKDDCRSDYSRVRTTELASLRYERRSDSHARVCADFKRKSPPWARRNQLRSQGIYWGNYPPEGVGLAGLTLPRADGGEHCYEGNFERDE